MHSLLALSDKKEEKMMKRNIVLETPEHDSVKEKEKEKKKDTSSELVEPESSKAEKKSSNKAKLGVNDVKINKPVAVSKFRISTQLREKLKEKRIEVLFLIQAAIFDLVLDGEELIGRTRTYQGKTLAFVLPILESLINGPANMICCCRRLRHLHFLVHAGRSMLSNTVAYEMLRSILPEDKVELIKGLEVTADAVFDVVQSDLDLFY